MIRRKRKKKRKRLPAARARARERDDLASSYARDSVWATTEERTARFRRKPSFPF